MISLSLTLSRSPPRPLNSLNSPFLRPRHTRYNRSRRLDKQSKLPDAKCRAEFSADTTVAAAIGACILTSYVFPATTPPEDSEGESVIGLGDARSAVMTIISFIPYFNWMSWVFAWLDTRKPRYAVYAIAYLAPYLRTNFSVSPEESWLPITSILLCIFHIQVETSATREDGQSSEFREDTARRLSSMTREKNNSSEKKEGKKDSQNPPSTLEQTPNGVSHLQSDNEIQNDKEDGNGGKTG